MNVLFTNFSNEDFTQKWDNVPYTFKAGESKYLPGYLAEHFAKHLIDRELNKNGKRTDDSSRQALLNNCGIVANAPQKPSLEAEIELMNINPSSISVLSAPISDEIKEIKFCDTCDSKGGRHKKECPKNKKESEFEGLQT